MHLGTFKGKLKPQQSGLDQQLLCPFKPRVINLWRKKKMKEKRLKALGGSKLWGRDRYVQGELGANKSYLNRSVCNCPSLWWQHWSLPGAERDHPQGKSHDLLSGRKRVVREPILHLLFSGAFNLKWPVCQSSIFGDGFFWTPSYTTHHRKLPLR